MSRQCWVQRWHKSNVERYFCAIVAVFRLTTFTTQKAFSVLDFIDGVLASDIYDASVWTVLETLCQLTLPTSLKKPTTQASLKAVRQRAGFHKRLQRVLLLHRLRADASQLTGFDRIHSFERIEEYVTNLKISLSETLVLDLLDPAPDTLWDTIKREHADESLTIDLVTELANQENLGVGTSSEWRKPTATSDADAKRIKDLQSHIKLS